MATPEQIAYRRLQERKRLSAQRRRFENHCKYILGGVLSRRLQVSGWEGLGEVREFLKQTNNLGKIEEYMRMKGAAKDMDEAGVPEIGKSESFDKWIRKLVQETSKQELARKLKAYLYRNREFIRRGLSSKVLTFKDLAGKLSAELEAKVTAKKVQVIWYEIVRAEKESQGVGAEKQVAEAREELNEVKDSVVKESHMNLDMPSQEDSEDEEFILIRS